MNIFEIFFGFIGDIYRNKFVIGQLVKRDYKNRYLGSTLGFIWTIIQPIVMLVVLWMVFVLGFKSGSVTGANGQVVPFLPWFAIGLIAWNFFADALPGATGVFQEYSYLVKKINFRISVLPIVKISSAFITHLIFIVLGIIILVITGVPFSWYWLQVFYYLAAMMILLLGLSWIVSSLQVFAKDVAQMVSVILQFGFWLTPIVWNFNLVPFEYQFWFKLNPMFYIVDGYRRSFLFSEPFWGDQQVLGWYFWGVTLVILIIGVFLFRKLRPHFADVL